MNLRTILTAVASSALVMLSFGTFAAAATTTIQVNTSPVNYYVNGILVTPTSGMFNNQGVVSVSDSLVYDQTTYVPIRFAAELLGQQVAWNSSQQGVDITTGAGTTPATTTNVMKQPSSRTMLTISVDMQEIAFYVDGTNKTPPNGIFDNQGAKVPDGFIYNKTTYVPIRLAAQLLGQQLQWDTTLYSVDIGTPPSATGGGVVTAASFKHVDPTYLGTLLAWRFDPPAYPGAPTGLTFVYDDPEHSVIYFSFPDSLNPQTVVVQTGPHSFTNYPVPYRIDYNTLDRYWGGWDNPAPIVWFAEHVPNTFTVDSICSDFAPSLIQAMNGSHFYPGILTASPNLPGITTPANSQWYYARGYTFANNDLSGTPQVAVSGGKEAISKLAPLRDYPASGPLAAWWWNPPVRAGYRESQGVSFAYAISDPSKQNYIIDGDTWPGLPYTASSYYAIDKFWGGWDNPAPLIWEFEAAQKGKYMAGSQSDAFEPGQYYTAGVVHAMNMVHFAPGMVGGSDPPGITTPDDSHYVYGDGVQPARWFPLDPSLTPIAFGGKVTFASGDPNLDFARTTPEIAGMTWMPNALGVYGTGFGDRQGQAQVYVDGVEVPITSWMSYAIWVSVPTAGVSGGKAVTLKVVTGNGQSIQFTGVPKPQDQHFLTSNAPVSTTGPYIENNSLTTSGGGVGPWTNGGWSMHQGVTYNHGIALVAGTLASPTTVTFEVPVGTQRFYAAFGLDDSAANGTVAITVTGDGAVLWQGTVSGQDYYTETGLDVGGLQSLSISAYEETPGVNAVLDVMDPVIH